MNLNWSHLFESQIEYIQFLHKIRGPFLDRLIQLFDFFDKQEFFFVLLPLVWLGFGWRFGIRIFYLLSLSFIINYTLKQLFGLPRPFHIDPALGIIHANGYGFPSGGAQGAFLLSGLLVIYWNNHWKWTIAVAYTLLISFSRIYLGVHFPLDILGGWIVAFLLLLIYIFFFPIIEHFLRKRSFLTLLLLSEGIPVFLMFLFPSKTSFPVYAIAMGIGMGVFIGRFFNISMQAAKTKWDFCVRVLIGVAGTFIIYGLAWKIAPRPSLMSQFLLFSSIGLWISYFAYIACNLLGALGSKFFSKRN
jgi:undecaprenyl-diphosphatase